MTPPPRMTPRMAPSVRPAARLRSRKRTTKKLCSAMTVTISGARVIVIAKIR